jgi:hypothetical protein
MEKVVQPFEIFKTIFLFKFFELEKTIFEAVKNLNDLNKFEFDIKLNSIAAARHCSMGPPISALVSPVVCDHAPAPGSCQPPHTA